MRLGASEVDVACEWTGADWVGEVVATQTAGASAAQPWVASTVAGEARQLLDLPDRLIEKLRSTLDDSVLFRLHFERPVPVAPDGEARVCFEVVEGIGGAEWVATLAEATGVHIDEMLSIAGVGSSIDEALDAAVVSLLSRVGAEPANELVAQVVVERRYRLTSLG